MLAAVHLASYQIWIVAQAEKGVENLMSLTLNYETVRLYLSSHIN